MLRGSELIRPGVRLIQTKLSLLGLLLFSSVPAVAQPPSEALVREALDCIRAEERFILGRDAGFKVGFNSTPSAAALPESAKQEIFQLFQQVADQVFSWQIVEPRFIQMYQRYYSRAELEHLREFCSDPNYRALVEADLKMIPASMQIGTEFQPEMQRLMQNKLQEFLLQLSR